MSAAPFTVATFPTRDAWLTARRDPLAIGASEAAVALGVSPYRGPWELWSARQCSHEDDSAPVLQRGNRWESAVLAEYEDVSGARVVAPGAHFGRPGDVVMLASREHPWLRESPDAFALDAHTGELGHVEAKTAMHRDAWSPESGVVIEHWEEGHEDLVPAHYAVQAYVQLAVSGMPWNDLCALVPHGGWLAVRWVRLMRDEETQGQLVEAIATWREKHLVGGEPPEVDGSRACNRFLAKAFQPRPARLASVDEATQLRALATLRATKKAAEKEIEALANELVVRADGSRLVLSDERGAPYGQPQHIAGRVTVDTARLRADFPEVYAACQRTGEPSVSFNTYRFDKDPAP